MKKLLGDLGLDNSEGLSEFITTKRDADQAALTEVERQELRTAEAHAAQAAVRERTALQLAVLSGRGAAEGDRSDAILLMDRVLDDKPDADEEAVAAAAEQLKERRPEPFGQTRETTPAAPGASPMRRTALAWRCTARARVRPDWRWPGV